MSPAVVSNKLQEAPPDASPILPQWRLLASMNQQSPDFRSLLSSLNAEDNRSLTTQLCTADAKATLNIMDQASFRYSVRAIIHVAPSVQVFRGIGMMWEHGRDTFYTMRKLAYSSGQVPTSYQIDRTSLSAEAVVIARGAFAEPSRTFEKECWVTERWP
jgi:hypothetical protein